MEEGRGWLKDIFSYLQKAEKVIDSMFQDIKVDAATIVVKLHECMDFRSRKIQEAFNTSSSEHTIETLDVVDLRAFTELYKAYEWILKVPLADVDKYVKIISWSAVVIALTVSTSLLFLPELKLYAILTFLLGWAVWAVIRFATLLWLSVKMHGYKGKVNLLCVNSSQDFVLDSASNG